MWIPHGNRQASAGICRNQKLYSISYRHLISRSEIIWYQVLNDAAVFACISDWDVCIFLHSLCTLMLGLPQTRKWHERVVSCHHQFCVASECGSMAQLLHWWHQEMDTPKYRSIYDCDGGKTTHTHKNVQKRLNKCIELMSHLNQGCFGIRIDSRKRSSILLRYSFNPQLALTMSIGAGTTTPLDPTASWSYLG